MRRSFLCAESPVASGQTCIAKAMHDEHKAALYQVLAKAGLAGEVDVSEFRRYGSARKLYHFHIDNLGS